MKSEIRVVSPSLRITVILGVCLTVTIIVLAMLYKTEFSVILLAVAGSVVALGTVATIGGVYTLAHKRELSKLDLAERQQHLRLVTAQATKAEFESRIISIPSSQRVLMDEAAPVRIIEATAGSGYKLLADPQAAAPVNLLAALDSFQRCLIVGASDTGKTTLLQWIVARRLPTSKVIVIDPHAYPHKWPGGCVLVGTGRDYPKIDQALEALVRLMTKRYDEIGRGVVAEMHHERITILIDEWRAIVYNVKGASEAIKALLTESRKAAFSVFVATHSDRAKPLGLEGEYDLKDGFAVVRLTNVNGQRLATLDTGNGETPAALPGPFVGGPAGIDVTTCDPALLDLDPPRPTPIEAHILTLHQAGEPISAIAEQVYGSKGGNQNEKVKAILNRFRAYL
jgi:hypothetical protein